MSTTAAHAGTTAALLAQTSTANAVAPRTITGLTVGRSYTLEAWLASTQDAATVTSTSLGVTSIGDSTPVTAAGAVSGAVTWAKSTYTFTATATSHTVHVTAASTSGTAGVLIDDVVLTQDAWSNPGTVQPAVNDSVVRSQTGRILQNTLTDGATTAVSTYTYDAAGRLIAATIPHHQLTYGFATTGGCGADAAAGRNGNRTAFSDTKDAGTPATVAYCYDNADRLTATTVTNPPAGASPVAGSNLTASTLQYDAHGNTTTLGNQTMTYDITDRHMSTTVVDTAGTSVVTYQRDVTGRIVARTSTVGTTSTTIEYLYAGGTFFGVANGSGVLVSALRRLVR